MELSQENMNVVSCLNNSVGIKQGWREYAAQRGQVEQHKILDWVFS